MCVPQGTLTSETYTDAGWRPLVTRTSTSLGKSADSAEIQKCTAHTGCLRFFPSHSLTSAKLITLTHVCKADHSEPVPSVFSIISRCEFVSQENDLQYNYLIDRLSICKASGQIWPHRSGAHAARGSCVRWAAGLAHPCLPSSLQRRLGQHYLLAPRGCWRDRHGALSKTVQQCLQQTRYCPCCHL